MGHIMEICNLHVNSFITVIIRNMYLLTLHLSVIYSLISQEYKVHLKYLWLAGTIVDQCWHRVYPHGIISLL